MLQSKTRFKSKYLIFLMCISRKLTFWNLTDVKKSKNKNELLHNVTYNYQKSECHWIFATILNFHRPSLPYEISKNFLTSPNEHTVVCWLWHWPVKKPISFKMPKRCLISKLYKVHLSTIVEISRQMTLQSYCKKFSHSST